jgi:hypothetical protein
MSSGCANAALIAMMLDFLLQQPLLRLILSDLLVLQLVIRQHAVFGKPLASGGVALNRVARTSAD